jgi:hypothetical protein
MRQEKDNYCVCAVLQEIFNMHKINLSQDYISQNLTSAKDGFRIDDDKIKNFLKENNFDYSFYWWNQIPFNEPDMLLKEIHGNNGFIGIGNHAQFVLEFQDPILTIMDPANEKVCDDDYHSVLSRLRKYDGGFGLIKHI